MGQAAAGGAADSIRGSRLRTALIHVRRRSGRPFQQRRLQHDIVGRDSAVPEFFDDAAPINGGENVERGLVV